MPAFGCVDLESFGGKSFETYRETGDDTDMESSSEDLFDLTALQRSLPMLSSTLVEDEFPAHSAELLEAGTLNANDLFSTAMDASRGRGKRHRSGRGFPWWSFCIGGMVFGGILILIFITTPGPRLRLKSIPKSIKE